MIFIWGEKKKTSVLGHVAEICPTCKAARAFHVSRVSMYSHLYYIPLGPGRLLGYVGECLQCRGRFNVLPTNYLGFERASTTELIELVTKTNPKLLTANTQAQREFTRFDALREPLLKLDQRFAEWCSKPLNGPAVAVIGALATWWLTAYLLSLLPKAAHDAVWWLHFVGLFGGGYAMYWLMTRRKKHFVQTNLVPPLIDTYRQLGATATELDACLDILRKFDYRAGKFVDGRRLVEQDGVLDAEKASA